MQSAPLGISDGQILPALRRFGGERKVRWVAPRDPLAIKRWETALDAGDDLSPRLVQGIGRGPAVDPNLYEVSHLLFVLPHVDAIGPNDDIEHRVRYIKPESVASYR